MKLWALPLLCTLAANAQQTCVTCHVKQKPQSATGMSHALSTPAEGDILRTHNRLTFQQGPYSYTIERQGAQSIYKVSDGHDEFSTPISWAFGLGAAGQTYLLNRNGLWYESRVSYYRETGNLDLTVGAQPGIPHDLNEAAGRELSRKGAEECFSCHATGAVRGGALNVDALTPGVQCLRCHGDAADHVTRMAVPNRLGKLSTEEVSDFCGQCHRTWATIASQGPNNITNVRFQPYRLVNSKCYDSTDPRIRCTACHDPHNDTPKAAAFYDARCTACHSPGGKAGAKLCPTAKVNCAECHMPKVLIASAHNRFTDHWIRIARPGDKTPY